LEDSILTLLEKIPQLENGNRVILGIDGLSRSGKTTFANKVKQALQEKNVPLRVFHIDDYIVERKRRYNTENEEWFEYYNLQWEVEWLNNNFFQKLKISNELHLPTYDNHSDTHRVKSVNLPETCFIIVEGVFLQRSEWKRFYDFMLYIDCPREKRFNRESVGTQSNIGKFKNRYWKAEDYYIKTEAPMKQADLVFRN
jgi:uridine kinase